MEIVIDMGGTNTRIAFSNDLKTFTSIERLPTPQTKEEAHKKISEILSPKMDDIENILFGIAGFVDYENKIVINAPYIPWIKNISAAEITGIHNRHIRLFNDAELAGVAESYQSYANNFRNVAYIAISTGVGGTIVRNKKPATHSYNYEPGHIIIDKSSTVDSPVDNIRGSFESLCSGTAFYEKYKIQPKDCTDKEIWMKYGSDLADGLYTLTLLWQPEAIVLGGSMTNQWELFYDAMVQRYTSYPSYYAHPTILRSDMKDLNGLIGGLKILTAN